MEENATEAQLHLERLKKNLKVKISGKSENGIQRQVGLDNPELILVSNTIFVTSQDKPG